MKCADKSEKNYEHIVEELTKEVTGLRKRLEESES